MSYLNIICSFLLFAVLSVRPGYNLDFELIDSQTKIPYGWDFKGEHMPTKGYFFSIDSNTVQSGRYALLMAPDPAAKEKTDGICTYVIKGPFSGKRIQLSGYLKTERVSPGGFAGLWIRVEGDHGMLAFDNMEKRQINGTNDWEAFTTTVPLNPDATRILIGGWLQGNGKAWIDNLGIEYVE